MKNYIYVFLLILAFSIVGCSDEENFDKKLETFNFSLDVSFSGMESVCINECSKLSLYNKGGNKIADLLYSSSNESIYTFSAELNQLISAGDEYIAVFPASDAPVYDPNIGVIKATQEGADSDSHLSVMSKFEGFFKYNNGEVVTLNNKLSVLNVKLDKPENVNGVPIQADFTITETSSDNKTKLFKSVLQFEDLNDWNNVIANIAILPKLKSVVRNIECVVTTSSFDHYKQVIVHNENVEYAEGESMPLVINALKYIEPTFVDADQVVTLTDDVKQKICIGLDAERLWYWRDNMRDELAQLSVGDINVKFARVAIDGGYELNKGVKKPEVYDIQLRMMRAFKEKRPDLLFFATPRPIFNSYTEEERVELFGHKDNTPWSSVPLWVYEFKENGTKKMPDGTIVPNYVPAGYNWENLTAYFADYLNFMHDNGFDFEYMDLTNETETRTTPDVYKYVYDNLKSKLKPGVKMPILIAPSSWSVMGGVEWMKTVKEDEKSAFGVAAVHNTGDRGGKLETFASLANQMGKPAWNTELHDWVGITTKDEILTADNFFHYFRSGFTGMSGWLFFGPANGKDHAKLWVNAVAGKHIKSVKYEVFKAIVNNVNDGNYLESVEDRNIDGITNTTFIKDNIISIAVLNKTDRNKIVTYDLGTKIIDEKINGIEWNENLSKSGKSFELEPITKSKFQFSVGAESLYILNIKLK